MATTVKTEQVINYNYNFTAKIKFMDNSFSVINRVKILQNAAQQNFDVVIFGGGITGAGIALDATLRGLSVLLIEKNDFASGTSGRSTKLVHGGLRYLEKLQLGFVAQLGRERKIIHNNAMHNVIPTPMLLPIIKGGQLKKGLTYIALKIYDVLAGVKSGYRASWIKPGILIKKYPFLNSPNLKGAFLYYEYKTNDSRLVIEVIKTAVDKGATAINYVIPIKLETNVNKYNKALVTDILHNTTYNINSKCFVNATGPFCAQVAQSFNVNIPKKLYPTKGVHIVFNKTDLPINEAFYFDTADKRMVFAIPRQNYVYVGTTDTPYNNNLQYPECTNDDKIYLLNTVNQRFAGLNLTINNIVAVWAGVRPLILNKGKNPGEISRKDEIFVSPQGLITITGGKLTGYRLMAKKTVNLIFKTLVKTSVKCTTNKTNLLGGHFNKNLSTINLIEIADQKYDEAKQTGIDSQHFKKLFYRYGSNIDILTEKAYQLLRQFDTPQMLWIYVEVWYSVNFEMTTNLSDFLIRRTESVMFDLDLINNNFDAVVKAFEHILGWTETDKKIQIDNFNNELNFYR